MGLSTDSTAIILGDSNLQDLRCENAKIFALPNGRLNYFRGSLRLTDQVTTDVKHFVLFASFLDRKNLFASNSKALTHIFSLASRTFPNARLAYVCDGVCSCESHEINNATELFNRKISDRPPKNCVVIKAPSHFSCQDGTWDEATKSYYFDAVHSFLD